MAAARRDHTCQIKNDKMNIIDAIQHPPYSICPEGRQIFRRYWSGDVKGELHKILLWASDEMLGLLRLNSHTFIDGTFRSSPLPFKQLVVIMTFDPSSEMFVPCCYALVTAKNGWLYSEIFHMLVTLLNYRWLPKLMTADYEKALIKAIKESFPVVNPDHISIAIDFIKERCKNQVSVEALTLIGRFFLYFENTWMKSYEIQDWNVYHLRGNPELMNRTNNCCESDNRRINEKFPTTHPPLSTFIGVIQSEIFYFSKRLECIRKGIEQVPFTEKFVDIPLIPIELEEFINEKRINK
ncbi:hypothetical protein O9G_004215 [Rozella allomycis CSF55]|uniref:MULE transposase domain-containing protein n=1 Tax=Rozella allomycis (strain CSF55) TaxID=988480 RepID=A0A075AQ32_ROZAC|nr:hypothetical protein O9G_004215 [Rozella allomycis CSF55]|eukprot:EPZ32240.1 hypothetical protein O9G_004215 [Rozella allomycis CSF55]